MESEDPEFKLLKDRVDELEKSKPEPDHLIKWQNKLLPWFVIMPTFLGVIFILLSTQQLIWFNDALTSKSNVIKQGDTNLSQNIDLSNNSTLLDKSRVDIYWTTLLSLEEESFYRRYNQGGMLLMSRIFTKYLGFFTGMILAIVGSVFIIGKISNNNTTTKATVRELFQLEIVSTSPGLIFGILGTTLMLTSILQHSDVVIQDTPLYLNPNTILATQLIINREDSLNKIDPEVIDSLGWNTNEK